MAVTLHEKPIVAPSPHKLGGGHHDPDTLANLNTKVSDATLDDESNPRPPIDHGNEAHTPDFEEEGVAAWLIATHVAAPDPHTGYIKHSLATAISDFLVASGAGVFIKKTLAEVKTLLNWAADIATHAALTVTHGATGAIVGTTNAQALTNKTLIATSNVVEEITTVASDATPNPTGGSLRNFYTITALAAGATFAVPSGTPANANKLIIRIKDNGAARALAWNAIYRRLEFALPTTTVISKTMYLGFIYNSADSKWDMVAINEEA